MCRHHEYVCGVEKHQKALYFLHLPVGHHEKSGKTNVLIIVSASAKGHWQKSSLYNLSLVDSRVLKANADEIMLLYYLIVFIIML